MLLNCGVGEDTWESIGQQGDWSIQSYLFIYLFIGRTDAEAEAPVVWPPDAKSWLTEKEADAGKEWGQEEKGVTEDKIIGWHHWLNRHEFEQTPGDSEGHISLACCSSWGCRKPDMTMNWKATASVVNHMAYWKYSKRVDLKWSYHKNNQMLPMRADGYII